MLNFRGEGNKGLTKFNRLNIESIIEKTLVYLDVDEIKVLFELYGKQMVKHVWLERLVPQGDYLFTLNRFFAWFYFRVKNPDMYIKSMETRILNRRMK